MSTALKLRIEPLDGGPSTELAAGMVEARQWERANGGSVAKALDESPTILVELAHIAAKRRLRLDLSLDEFEERFDVELVAGGEAPADPSDPATAPPSD